MKYLRKLVLLLLGVAFLVAALICVGRIFAIKNVNVNLITYEEEYSESYAEAKKTLSVYKGESIFFINEKDVAERFAGSNYVVSSCVKRYPCTLNVTIKERLEIFAVSVGGRYSMYDDNGEYMRRDDENINEDGSPNVEVTGIATEQMSTVANFANMFKTQFGGLRSIVESINVDSRPGIDGYRERMTLNLRCGLVIQFIDYSQDCEEMIAAAHEKFCKLDDKEKLSGRMRVQRLDGEIYAGMVSA